MYLKEDYRSSQERLAQVGGRSEKESDGREEDNINSPGNSEINEYW